MQKICRRDAGTKRGPGWVLDSGCHARNIAIWWSALQLTISGICQNVQKRVGRFVVWAVHSVLCLQNLPPRMRPQCWWLVGYHARGTQPAPPQSVRQLLQPGGFRRKVGAKFPAGFRLRENALWVSAQLVCQPPGKDRNTGNPRIGFPFGICNLWQMLLTLKDVNLRNVGAQMPSNLRGG